MELEFVKMEGLGNDFVLFDDRNGNLYRSGRSYPELAKRICDRRFGIGADGIILILNPVDDHDIKFRIYNCDGSQAEMCGNGMRCFAKLLYEKGIITKPVIHVDTKAGTVIPEVITDSGGNVVSVKVDMGVPHLDNEKIPVTGSQSKSKTIDALLKAGGTTYRATCVSMGNPHTVIFVDDVATIPLEVIGPKIETHEWFPEKTNVEFIEVINKTELKMRVWERGAGVTLACGTGACASHVAANLTGRAGEKTLIHLDGGDLELFWDRATNHVFKTGPASFVFEGRVRI